MNNLVYLVSFGIFLSAESLFIKHLLIALYYWIRKIIINLFLLYFQISKVFKTLISYLIALILFLLKFNLWIFLEVKLLLNFSSHSPKAAKSPVQIIQRVNHLDHQPPFVCALMVFVTWSMFESLDCAALVWCVLMTLEESQKKYFRRHLSNIFKYFIFCKFVILQIN